MAEHTTAYIRRRIVECWRDRSFHGVWFYGSWLASRMYVGPIIVGIASVIVGIGLGGVIFNA